jgi:polar amino acid transport system substrate-binding protein
MVDFSVPYYVANQTILTHQNNQTPLNVATDLKDYIVGAQDGTTGYTYIKENLVDKNLLPKENLRIYAVISDAVKALVAGECDFLILDNSPAQSFQKQYPLKTALTIETFESYGIALPKNAPLNGKINQALQDLIDSGEVLSIIQTHLK